METIIYRKHEATTLQYFNITADPFWFSVQFPHGILRLCGLILPSFVSLVARVKCRHAISNLVDLIGIGAEKYTTS